MKFSSCVNAIARRNARQAAVRLLLDGYKMDPAALWFK
jgi:hypothetical protein